MLISHECLGADWYDRTEFQKVPVIGQVSTALQFFTMDLYLVLGC